MRKSKLGFDLAEKMVSVKEFFTTLLTAFFLFVLPLLILSKFAKAESILTNEVEFETVVFFPLLSDIDQTPLSKLNTLSSYLGLEQFPEVVAIGFDQDSYTVYDLYRTQLDTLVDSIINLKKENKNEFALLKQLFSEDLINFAINSQLQLWKFPGEFSGICYSGNAAEVAYILQAAYESFMVDEFNLIAWRHKTTEVSFYPEADLSALVSQWATSSQLLNIEEDESVLVLSNLSEELVDLKVSVVPMCVDTSKTISLKLCSYSGKLCSMY
ncbi:MAG: hypothetical protein KBD78_08025 [Oligoflexales bacterium]|nr:hypothetical protein [Oligoflexales bacterium]